MAPRLLILAFWSLAASALFGQFSTFEVSSENWGTAGDAQNSQAFHIPTFGNPPGCIKGIDAGLGQAWFFAAPPCFLGDVSWAYGQTLEYDLLVSDVSATYYPGDIVIGTGAGQQFFFNFGSNATTTWQTKTVPLIETEWHAGTALGAAPTAQEFQNALADVQFLHIKGEYYGQLDQGYLDNVRLGWLPTTQVKKTICAGDSVVFGQKSFKTTGVFEFSTPNSKGCDSLIQLDLTVLDSSLEIRKAAICAGERLALPDGSATDAAGRYLFKFSAANGCDSSILVVLEVFPSADTVVEMLLREGQTAVLPDGSTARDTSFEAVFVLKTQKGCDSTVVFRFRTVFIDLFFPNVFSPDDDGLNDEWRPEAGAGVRLIRRLAIFDRWGELVFDEKNFAPSERGWNGSFRGKKMDAGVFAFWAEIELFDGSTEKRTGDFLLVR